MILGPVVHTLPSQLVIVEWGLGNGTVMPAANEAFTSGWFDTWRLNPERVIQPKGGQVVSTDDASIFGAGQSRRAGVYFLDLFVRHTNNAGLALPVTIEEIMAPALMSIAFVAFTPRLVLQVDSSGIGGALDQTIYFSRSVRVRNRNVRVSFTYPNSAPIDWYFSAVLRSA